MSEANVNEKKERGARKTRTGIVVSDKMNKTIVVELEDRSQQPCRRACRRYVWT